MESGTPDGRFIGRMNDNKNTTTETMKNTRKGRDTNLPSMAKTIVAPIVATALSMIILGTGKGPRGPSGPPIGIMYYIHITPLVIQ